MSITYAFPIEDAHVKPIIKVDPALTTTLPAVGYIVHPFRDYKKMKLYPVDGFKVGVLTDVGARSLAGPSGRKQKLMMIGTSIDQRPFDKVYTDTLRKKGKTAVEIRNAHYSVRIHHEAIHVRILVDLERAQSNKIPLEELSVVTINYSLVVMKFYNTDEARALRKTIEEVVVLLGAGAAFIEHYIESFLHEKFAMDRVNSLTPDFHVPTREIVDYYHGLFERELRALPGFLQRRANNDFLPQFVSKMKDVKTALTNLYARIDADAAAAGAPQTP